MHFSSYNPHFIAYLLLTLLVVAQGGREIIGLCLYHIFSLIFFYNVIASPKGVSIPLFPPLEKGDEGEFEIASGSTTPRNDRQGRTPLAFPIFAFLLVCAISTIYSILTQHRGLIHFATILIHSLNFYSLRRIMDDCFETRFFDLAVLISVILSLGILGQLAFTGIQTFFFPNQNLLASFINCGILILLCKISETIPAEKLKGKVLLWGGMSILLLAELSLFSRGAFFALSCALIFLLLVSPKRKKLPIFLLIVLVPIFALLYPPFRNVLTAKIISAPSDTRLVIYQTAIQAFMQKPILGWGMGSFGQLYDQLKLPIESDIARYEKTTSFAHNEFLELLVETGIIGLGCFLWLIFAILKTGFYSLREETNWRKIAAFSCLISLLSHALLDFNLHLPILAFLMIFCAVILVSPLPTGESKGSRHLSVGYRFVLTIWGLVSFSVLLSELSSIYAGSQKQEGNSLRAAKFYRMAAIFNPLYSKNFYELAHLSEGSEKEKWLKKALQWAPGNSTFHRDLGFYYLQQGKHTEAIRQYQKAIEKNPKKVFYYGELAQIYLALGEAGLARPLFQEALRIEPLYALAHQKLGEIYLRSDNKKLAEKHFSTLKKIQESELNPGTDYSKRLLAAAHPITHPTPTRVGPPLLIEGNDP